MFGRNLQLAGRLGRLRDSSFVTGVAANFTALGSQVVVQLLSVPVLTAAYGVEGFGIWLILSAIPTYLTMSDLGLVTAATSEMGIRWSRGDERGTLALFQSVWAGMALMAALVTLAAVGIILATGGVGGPWPEELQSHLWVIPILAGYATLYQLSFVAVAGLRGTGYFARGTLLGETPTFLEGLAMLTVATITRDMTLAASAMLAIRAVSTPLIYLAMRRARPQLRIGRERASWRELRALLPSSVGVLTIPASMGITLQGTSLVIGALIGPAAVAVFSSVRTLSRFALQIASMVVRAIVPELAGAHGRGDAAATRRYWVLFERARWLILVPAAFAFALLGRWLIELWSLGRLDAPPVLAVVMGLALLPHGSWFLDFFMLSATHNHVAVARPILMWSLVGLGLVVLGTSALGLLGAALATLAIDLVLAWRVRRAARALWIASADTRSTV